MTENEGAKDMAELDELSRARATDEVRRRVATLLADREEKVLDAAILLLVALEKTKLTPPPYRWIERIWRMGIGLNIEAVHLLRQAQLSVPDEDVKMVSDIAAASMAAPRFVNYGLDFGGAQTLNELVDNLHMKMMVWSRNRIDTAISRIEIVIP